ncbi:MAG: hypothetical protein JW706_07235 [Opitutales bacterium]|nr:hypothetical protein [Opitutales bacterium]
MGRWRNHCPDNHIHFFTAGIVGHVPIFTDNVLCEEILGIWNDSRRRVGFSILGYVLMPDHIHLLTHFEQGADCRAFYRDANHRFAHEAFVHLHSRGDMSRWLDVFHAARGKSGAHRVWKPEPRSFPIAKRSMAEQKLNYIHMNPVRRGLVADPCDWCWSSARDYLQGIQGPLRVDVEAFPLL